MKTNSLKRLRLTEFSILISEGKGEGAWSTVYQSGSSLFNSCDASSGRSLLIIWSKFRPSTAPVVDDVIAMGIMDSMKEAGRSVPDDVSVVGFDDIPSAGWAAYSLSTVQQPVDAMIDHTLKILNDGISSEPAEVRIPGKLIIRSSFRGNVEK